MRQRTEADLFDNRFCCFCFRKFQPGDTVHHFVPEPFYGRGYVLVQPEEKTACPECSVSSEWDQDRVVVDGEWYWPNMCSGCGNEVHADGKFHFDAVSVQFFCGHKCYQDAVDRWRGMRLNHVCLSYDRYQISHRCWRMVSNNDFGKTF